MSDIQNIGNLLGMARSATLAGNNAEALSYYNRVLEVDPRCSEAWVGKGKAAAWASTLANFRLGEALVAFGHAIGSAEERQKQALSVEVASEINKLVTALYSLARDHLIEFASLENSWPTYINQISQMLDALEEAGEWDPQNRVTFENIQHLCKDTIEGVAYRDKFNQNAPRLLSLNPQYEKLLQTRRETATIRIKMIDPTYSPPAVEKKTAEACFVVTATMGDENHPTVILMRRFRDERLRKFKSGEVAISIYYVIGPIIADLIRPSNALRRASYLLIVRPSAALARKFINDQ